MIITAATLQALRTSFMASFQQGLTNAPTQYSQIATTVTSTSASNTYGWLGSFPKMQEWIGDRPMTNLKEYGYQIQNKTWADGIEVGRDQIEDDNLGMYGSILETMGQNAAVFPDELIFPLLTNGFNNTCYDGQNFFDTDHPVYPNTDGSGTAASVANVYMQSDDWAGTPFYLLDCSRPIKPLVYQDRRKPALTSVTDPTSEAVFTSNSFKYGCDLRSNAGYTFWQLAYAGLCDLTSDNLWTCWQSMRQITGDGDRRLAIRPTHLVVPPQLEKQATQLLNWEITAGENGTTGNEWKGKLKLIVADYL
ncbi:Mu-like prophage major head subunit gpT family protein [Rahnella contaminans]|uniref:Mu-like prophage major head subunit gpT family protein n=1 Tax=Rahnella contaminans TaxID=2703882 RepID=UPI003C2D0AA2